MMMDAEEIKMKLETALDREIDYEWGMSQDNKVVDLIDKLIIARIEERLPHHESENNA